MNHLFSWTVCLMLSLFISSIGYTARVGGGFHDGGANYSGNGVYHDADPGIGNYHPGTGWVAPVVILNNNEGAINNNCQTVQQCDAYDNCTSTQQCD